MLQRALGLLQLSENVCVHGDTNVCLLVLIYRVCVTGDYMQLTPESLESRVLAVS